MGSSRRLFWMFLVSATWLTASVGCGDGADDEARREKALVCSDERLENTVLASDWATDRAGIEHYRYTADVAGGVADIELLGADHETLGTIAVRQVFGESDVPDGAMEAVLDDGSSETLRLVTFGERVSDRGYTVRMRVAPPDGGRTLDLTARFETVVCWDVAEPAAGPPCASGLPLDSAAYTLPTCGLVADERIRERRPPALARLAYAVRADDAAGTPAIGGTSRAGQALSYRLQIHGPEGVRDAETVGRWLRETGLDATVGTEGERLLTTAFLDRTWWRTLDRHVAHCDIQRLPRPETNASASEAGSGRAKLRTQRLSLCPGDHDSGSWGAGDDSDGGRVWGDPHIVTFDGHSYDLQAAGEFVLFEATAGDPMLVQGRFEPLENPAVPECGEITWNTAAATRVGGRRVSVRTRPEWEVRIDGDRVDEPGDVPELADGASIELGGDEMTVGWPDGSEVVFSRRGISKRRSLNIDASLPPERRGQVRGLFGQPDGEAANDLVLPDGTVIDQPASFDVLYRVLAPAWRVDEADSLFDYATGESHATFQRPGFPNAPVSVDDLPEKLAAEAESTCREEEIVDPHLLSACILDVVCLDDPGQAQASAETETPLSSQAPGREDAVVHGAVRRIPTPETVVAKPKTERDTCEPKTEPAIAFFDERPTATLGEDLDVDLADPGAYRLDHGTDPATVAKGTEIVTYQLLQTGPEHEDFPYSGGVRFAQPILGVLVDGAAVAASDAELGAVQTDYSGDGFEGLRTDDDVVRIGEDRRSLEVVWRGEGSRRLRILTEVPTP